MASSEIKEKQQIRNQTFELQHASYKGNKREYLPI